MRHGARFLCVSAAMMAWVWIGLPAPAVAQVDPAQQPTQQADEQSDQPPPGHVSALEGTARLEREGEISDVEAGLPLVPGDRLETEAGRVEVTLLDGTTLHLDRYGSLDWASDLVVRLGRGRVLVTLPASATDRLSVEAPGALARFDGEGQYRISVGGEEAVTVELVALRGSAELVNDAGALRLAGGQRSVVRDGQAPSAAEWVAPDASSTLERWADERLAATADATTASRSYLPSELGTYANTFDHYGSWQTDPSYGYVWYPTVAVDWRPYHRGRWSHMRRYGWTWVAHDPWGWPTHHYGRWELSGRGSWFWIPSRRWGPAWVYWATTPTYVGWCPLGWNGRPVVNVFSFGGVHHSRGRDPWRAWTVSSVGSFGRPGRGHHVDRRILDRDQPSFVMQHVPPGFAPSRRPGGQRVGQRAGQDRQWSTGGPERRPGAAGSSRGTWGDPARGTSGRRGSSWGDPARGAGGSSWGDPARGSGGSSWGDPAGASRPRQGTRPGYTGPRVTDPGSRAPSPYDRAGAYTDPGTHVGARQPRAGDGRAPSAGDDNGRSAYGPYAVPRRGPDRGSDPGDGRSRSYGARPDSGARTPDPAGRSQSSPSGSRPGVGRSSSGDGGGSRQAAPRGDRGDGGSRRSGGDGGSRGSSPRRRP